MADSVCPGWIRAESKAICKKSSQQSTVKN